MEVAEAKKLKTEMEEAILNNLLFYEKTTGLEIAAVSIGRLDASEMGSPSRSILQVVVIDVGIDVPANVGVQE